MAKLTLRSIIFSLFFLPSAILAGGTGPQPSRQTMFYVSNFDQAYLGIGAGLYIFHVCQSASFKQCGMTFSSDQNNTFDAIYNALKQVNLFPTHDKTLEAKTFYSSEEVLREFKIQQTKFMRNAFNYEVDFIARYSAVGLACPRPQSDSRKDKDLQETSRIIEAADFESFWNIPLAERQKLASEIEEKKQSYLIVIKSDYKAEECSSIREFGSLLAQSLKDKLKPYVKNDLSSKSENLNYGNEIAFIWNVANDFQAITNRDNTMQAGKSAH